jgi:L-alanine-DL-glutamate epimerase-like enolase superfamily enzyme
MAVRALMIDCAGLFSLNGAMQMIRGLQGYPMLFIEEPVCVDNLNEMERLHQANLGFNLALGERLCTRWAFRDYLERRVLDVIQDEQLPDSGILPLQPALFYGAKPGD